MSSSLRAIRSLDEALALALDDLGAGLSQVEVLARYPGYENELAPLLATAARLRRSDWPVLSMSARVRGRERMHIALSQQRTRRALVVPPLWRQLGASLLLVALTVTAFMAWPGRRSDNTSMPGATLTVEATPSPSPSVEPTFTPAPTVTPLPSSTLTPEPTEPPEAADSILSITRTATPTLTPTGTPTSTFTPSPTSTATHTPTPTLTPTGIVAGAAADTPVPSQPSDDNDDPTDEPTPSATTVVTETPPPQPTQEPTATRSVPTDLPPLPTGPPRLPTDLPPPPTLFLPASADLAAAQTP